MLGQYGTQVDVAAIKAAQQAAGDNEDIRINSDEAKRLKNDTAFKEFIQDVRDVQIKHIRKQRCFKKLSNVKRRTQLCVH